MPSETARSDDAWRVVPRAETRRTMRRMVTTFVVTLLVGSLLQISFVVFAGTDPLGLLPLAFSFIAAGIAAVTTTYDYGNTLKAASGDDASLRKRIRRVVLRGRSESLEGSDLSRAARWASMFAAYQPLIEFGALLNVTGVGILPLNSVLFSRRSDLFDPLQLGLLVLVVVAIATTITVTTRQTRRARAFAQQHRHLLGVQ